MIRDRIVMGILDKTTQERLLRESQLTLTKAIEFCRAIEISKQQSKTMQESSTDVQVDAVKHNKHNQSMQSCKYCGYKHDTKKKCPALGKTCAICQGRNHFASVCRNKGKKNQTRKGNETSERRKKVDDVQKKEDRTDQEDSDSDEFFVDSVKSVGAVGVNKEEDTMWKQKLIVDGKEIEFKLDTGAEVSILPAYVLDRCKILKVKVKPTKVTLVAYGSDKFKIRPIGEISLECSCKNRNAIVDFIVVDCKNQVPLLGLAGCMALKLIRRVDNVVKNVNTNFRSLEELKSKYSKV